jgi:4-amino-4-deoxy-L-arabinose transferase-like glycosyltransferase
MKAPRQLGRESRDNFQVTNFALHLQSYRTIRRSILFWGIVFSALILRVGFIVLLSPTIDSGYTLSVDALSYHQIAQNLIERQIFTSSLDPPYDLQLPGTFRPPLTPFYLAVIYKICGVNLLWGRFGLALISALSCGLTYLLGEKLFGRIIGLLAGIISCGYPFFLLLVHLPLTEGLSIFLSLILIILLYSYNLQGEIGNSEKHSQLYILGFVSRWRWEIGIGGVFGLALLNKASNIALFPCILLTLLLPGLQRKRSFKLSVVKLAVVGIGSMITILPWTMRNYEVTGTFILVNSNGGWTFYLGNNPYTEKNLIALEQGTANGWIPPKEVFQPFSDLSFADLNAWEKRSLQLGYTFIQDNPGRFFHFAFRKLKIFWSPYQNFLDKITWYPLALFCVIGLYCSFASWKQNVILYILVLSTMIIPIFFTSMPRFRAPIMPVIVIYGAAGIVKVGSWLLSYANRN